MILYILRHGEAEHASIHPERPLTENGKLEIQKLADSIGRLPVRTIYHSGKARAKETAEIIAQGLPVQQRDHLNPNDELDSILAEINAQNNNILIVSHMPFVSRLVSQLLFGNEQSHIIAFDTGTLVALEKEHGHWFIREVISPKDVRA